MKKDEKIFNEYLNKRSDFDNKIEDILVGTSSINNDIERKKTRAFKLIYFVPTIALILLFSIVLVLIINNKSNIETKEPIDNNKIEPVDNEIVKPDDNPNEVIKYSDVHVKNENTNLMLVEVESVRTDEYSFLSDNTNDLCIIALCKVVKNYFNSTAGEDLYKDVFINIPIKINYLDSDNNINYYNKSDIINALTKADSYLVYLDNINDELAFTIDNDKKIFYLVSNPINFNKESMIPIVEDLINYQIVDEILKSSEDDVLLIDEGKSLTDIEELITEEYGLKTEQDYFYYSKTTTSYINYIENNKCILKNGIELYFSDEYLSENIGVLLRINYIDINDKKYLNYFHKVENEKIHTGVITDVNANTIHIIDERGYGYLYSLKYLGVVTYDNEIINLKDVKRYSQIEFTTALGDDYCDYICNIKITKMAETIITSLEEVAICSLADDVSLYLEKYNDNDLMVNNFSASWDNVEIIDLDGKVISRYDVTPKYVIKVHYDKKFDGYNTFYILNKIEVIGYNENEFEELSKVTYFYSLPFDAENNKYINCAKGSTVGSVEYSSDTLFLDSSGNTISKYSLEANDKLEIIYYEFTKATKYVSKIILTEKHPISPAYEDIDAEVIDAKYNSTSGKINQITINCGDKNEDYSVFNNTSIVNTNNESVNELVYTDKVRINFVKTFNYGVWDKKINKITLLEPGNYYLVTLNISNTVKREYAVKNSYYSLPDYTDHEGNLLSWSYSIDGSQYEVTNGMIIDKNYSFYLNDNTNLLFELSENEEEVIIVGSKNSSNGDQELVIYNEIIGKKVKKIEKIYGGYYKHIIIENGITEIDNYAFSSNNTETISFIGEGVINVGKYAFRGCKKLKTIDFANNIVYLNYGVFSDCKLLETIYAKELIVIDSTQLFSNCKALKDITITTNSIGSECFKGCEVLENVIINDAEIINSYAFENCVNLKSLNVSNVKEINGEKSFSGCVSLQEFIAPKIEKIGARAFENCALLAHFDFSNVKSVNDYAFYGCSSLNDVELTSLEEIGNYVFYRCKNLERVVIGDNAIKIGIGIVLECPNLSYLQIPNLGSIPNVPNRIISYFSHNFQSWSYSSEWVNKSYEVKYYDNILRKNINARIPLSLETIVVTKDEYIFKNSFAYLSSLTSITYYSQLKLIEADSFVGCNVSLIYYDNNTYLEDGWNNGLKEVN